MKKPFTSHIHSPATLAAPALWFVFKGEEILIQKIQNQMSIPELIDITAFDLQILHQHYLGVYDNTHCFVAEVAENSISPESMAFQHLRQSYEALSDNEDLFLLASRAKQILLWDKSTRFCGYCGQETTLSTTERAKTCSHCNAVFYPHVAPVILVRIHRQKQLLLARSPHFTKGIYSVLAGFVEPGESAEQTVVREVFEEVGIKIKNIQYFGSQPWPFPSNLMLAFTAEYESGEIVIDNIEIEDAGWFSVDQLPELPKKLSLSRKLIDDFIFSLR
ncbi:MAG TPA: NAD(+) diphosphatase [Gammaproteobacteria bacterium]|nr:NAD(+) diphosphatase [Gammaproteobacteria bacterium]